MGGGDTAPPCFDAMGREFEMKYRADDTALEAVREAYGDFSAIQMETTYYDTPDGALKSGRWTLRRRKENDRVVCTLKIPLPDGSRGEWEVLCDTVEEGVPRLIADGAPETLSELVSGGVEPVCGVRFLRLARRILWEGAVLELALDSGELLGGGKTQPFREIEVELKDGSDQGLEAFGQQLQNRFRLTPEPESKFQRASKLAEEDRREGNV